MSNVTCTQCSKPIESGEYMKTGEATLHKECVDDFMAATVGTCTHCDKPLIGEYVEFSGAHGDAKVHKDCIEAYKQATRPTCAGCNEKILDDSHMVLDDKKYHEKCVPE